MPSRILEGQAIPTPAPKAAPTNEIASEPVECDIVFERMQADADGRSNPGVELDQARFDDWGPEDESRTAEPRWGALARESVIPRASAVRRAAAGRESLNSSPNGPRAGQLN